MIPSGCIIVGGLVPVDRTISEIRAAGTKDRASLLIVCVCILYSCVFTWIHILWLSYCTILNNITNCWLWTKRMNTSFFYFHHSTIIIVSSIHVYKWFFTVWVDCDIHFHSFISIKIFFNYKIVLVLLVFHSKAIQKEFSIRLTYMIQNLYNILVHKYIMQCAGQALSERFTFQLLIK